MMLLQIVGMPKDAPELDCLRKRIAETMAPVLEQDLLVTFVCDMEPVEVCAGLLFRLEPFGEMTQKLEQDAAGLSEPLGELIQGYAKQHGHQFCCPFEITYVHPKTQYVLGVNG